MSKLTNVRVEVSSEVTINLGNFENVKPGFKASANVPEGMHPSEAKDMLQKLVDAWLEEEVRHYRKAAK